MANTAYHPPKLLDQLRAKIRLKHYGAGLCGLDQAVHLFHGKRHPNVMGGAEVESFLTHLAVNGKVSASTQNQAKAALLFLYREVLVQELPWLDNVEKAKAPKRLPVVLIREEAL